MAFPYDARIRTCVPNTPKRSADDNAIQDAIVALYQAHRVIIGATPMPATGVTLLGDSWSWLTPASSLMVPIPTLPGQVITGLRVKVFSASSKVVGASLLLCDSKMASAATTTGQSLLWSNGATVGANYWAVLDSGVLAVTMGAHEHLVLEIGIGGNAEALDQFGGCELY